MSAATGERLRRGDSAVTSATLMSMRGRFERLHVLSRHSGAGAEHIRPVLAHRLPQSERFYDTKSTDAAALAVFVPDIRLLALLFVIGTFARE